MLVFYLSVAISQLIGVSEHTISDWRIILHTRVADWLAANPSGIIVKLDEAKFGKRKYNKGAYWEEQWVLGGVEIFRGQ